MTENIIDHHDRASRLGRLVYVFIGTAFLLLMVWMMMPPPMFSGIAAALYIGYLVALIGVLISSFIWLHRFGNTEPDEDHVFQTRGYMTAWLVISILLFVGSISFALLAMLASGLFGMI